MTPPLWITWEVLAEDGHQIAVGTHRAAADEYETAMRVAEAIERALLALGPGAAVPNPEQLRVKQPGTVQ
jgi:hypothetical protein